MTKHIIEDFHDDGVFRDENGTVWVTQSQLVEAVMRVGIG